MRLPGVAGGVGPIPSEAYDSVLKEIFISDPEFNSVEVYSTLNGNFVGEISVPGPAGLSFSPDYSQLFVGTTTPYLYVVDPVGLHVTGVIQIPASVLSNNALGTTVMPVMPLAMADGSIVLGMGYNSESGSYAGTGVVHLVLYEPVGGTFTSIDPGASGISGNPSRSLNGEYVAVYAIGNSGLGFEVYSIAAQGYLPAFAALENGGVFLAANADGSQFASVQEVVAPGTGSFCSQVNFFGGTTLQAEAQYTIDATVTGALFSRDGKYLYLMTDLSYVVVLDTRAGTPDGYMSVAMGGLLLPPPPLYDVDETYHLFGAAPGGVFVLNASQAQPTPPTAVADFPTPFADASPNVGPVSGGTQVHFIPAPAASGGSADGIANSMEAYFGSIPAPTDTVGPYSSSSNGGNFLTSTSPWARGPGPVSVVLTDANNNAVFLPEAFTYGPHLLRVEPNAASAAGGDQVTISAYGLGFFDLSDIHVSIGGTQVNMTNATLNSYASFDYPEQSVTVPVPPGTPGWADIILTTSNGADVLKRGIQYLSHEVTVAGGPYGYAVYDAVRDLFYLTGNGNTVAVFNPNTLALAQSLASNSISAGAVLGAEALTPDSSKLLVVDSTDQSVIVFDLVGGTSTSVSALLASDPANTLVQPLTILTAANNRAFVSVTPCVTDPLREINLTNLSVQARPDAASSCGAYVPYPEYGGSSADGSTIIYAGNAGQEYGVDPPGAEYIWKYVAATDAFSGPAIVNDSPWVPLEGQAAINNNGSVIALEQGTLDQRLLPLVPIVVAGQDDRLNETGSLLYTASIENMEIGLSDTRNGRLQLMLAAQNTNGAVLAPDRPLAIDPTGGQIVLGLQSGIAYFQLAVVPLAVGTVTPATASPGGTIQLNGSGFVAGTTATIGGQSASCTEVNSETLSCTVPNLTTGATSISLTNPDGQTYSFENALVVQ
jgi:hypothetical protein